MNKFRLEKVKDLATKLHFGQKRKGGADYISHPIAVAEIAKKKKIDFFGYEQELLLAICYLHDVLEDCDVTSKELKLELKRLNYKDQNVDLIVENVGDLTRMSKDEDIVEYLEKVNSNLYSIWAKICDLEHNMSDLEPSNLLDKYKLFHYILTKHC